MTRVSHLIKLLLLKWRFGERLEIGEGVRIPWSAVFIIDKNSRVRIGAGTQLNELVELRATRQSKLDIGQDVKIDRLVRVIATNNTNVSIGAQARLGIGTIINGGGNISIGDKTLVSGYVYIQSSMHNHKTDDDIVNSGYVYGDIEVGRGCWLGAHSVIFPGVNLGDRVVVGSNAVVSKSFKSASVVGGIPAVKLK
jgi:acetyltransferase-like isoleucine patch superfamily enzyme